MLLEGAVAKLIFPAKLSLFPGKAVVQPALEDPLYLKKYSQNSGKLLNSKLYFTN
jgi:hypothetical protein